MCATPNLTSGFGYWHPADTHGTPTSTIADSTSLSCYGPPSILQDASKLKSVRRPMFLVNNKHTQESFNHTCEKGCPCEPLPMALGDKDTSYKEVSKHFMAPLGHNSCEKGCPCEPLPIGITEKDGKHFMTPLGPLQLTAEECNEILMKRAAAAAGANNQNQSHSPQSPPDTKPQLSGTAVKTRPYSCLECGKSFLLKHHLTTHARVHSGERPHICIHCGKTFAHKHCLNTHLLLHSSQRPYQCPECKKSFTLKHHLLTHSRVSKYINRILTYFKMHIKIQDNIV